MRTYDNSVVIFYGRNINMGVEDNVGNMLLETVSNMPGFKVYRNIFLKDILKQKDFDNDDVNKALEGSILDVLTLSEIEDIANKRIFIQKGKVTAFSAVLGIPGGAAMVASAPTDVVQFLYFSGILAQELAYLYGYNDLWDSTNNSIEGYDAIILFIGTMLGVGAASQVVKEITSRLAEHVPKQMMNKALSKNFIYKATKEVLKFIGIKVTKDKFTKSIGKAIPIFGAVISGGMTYYSFGKCAIELRDKLNEGIKDKNNICNGDNTTINME